jgi:2-polyprenyl-3-methyl-5-hydroxy-6-metoxy-1,4-benzoquinol methylase
VSETSTLWDAYYSTPQDEDYADEIGRCGVLAEIILTFPRKPMVLDVGCGVGNLCHFLPIGKKILSYRGIDISKVAIDIAKKRFPNEDRTVHPSGFEFECIGADEFEPGSYYDIVICSGVLGYFSNFEAMIDKYLATLTHFGGRMVIVGYLGGGGDRDVLAYVDNNFTKQLDITIESQIPRKKVWRIVTIGKEKK